MKLNHKTIAAREVLICFAAFYVFKHSTMFIQLNKYFVLHLERLKLE